MVSFKFIVGEHLVVANYARGPSVLVHLHCGEGIECYSIEPTKEQNDGRGGDHKRVAEPPEDIFATSNDS